MERTVKYINLANNRLHLRIDLICDVGRGTGRIMFRRRGRCGKRGRFSWRQKKVSGTEKQILKAGSYVTEFLNYCNLIPFEVSVE